MQPKRFAILRRLFVGLALLASCAAPSPAQILLEGDPLLLHPDLLTRGSIARWDWGRLLTIPVSRSDAPIIHVVRGSGGGERFVLQIPNIRIREIRDAVTGSGGEVVVAGHAASSAGKPIPFLASMNPDGKSFRVVETFPYHPTKVAVASDGVIWTAGYIYDPADPANYRRNIFKRFDHSGQLLDSLAARGRARPGIGGDAVSNSHLRASADGVFWLTSGMELIEFARDGGERMRIDGPKIDYRSSSMAAGCGGGVLVGGPHQGGWRVWALDRANRAWTPHDAPSSGLLLGCNGDSAIASVFSPLGVVVQRFSIP